MRIFGYVNLTLDISNVQSCAKRSYFMSFDYGSLPPLFPKDIFTTPDDKLENTLKNLSGDQLTLFLDAIVKQANRIKLEKFSQLTGKVITVLSEKRSNKELSNEAEIFLVFVQENIESIKKNCLVKRETEETGEEASAEGPAKKSKTGEVPTTEESDSKKKVQEASEGPSKKSRQTPSSQEKATDYPSFGKIPSDVLGGIGKFLQKKDLSSFMEVERATADSRAAIISGSSKHVMGILRQYNYDTADIEKKHPKVYADLQKYSSQITELHFPQGAGLNEEEQGAGLNEEKLRGILKVFTKLEGLSFENCMDVNQIPIQAFPNNLKFLSVVFSNIHDEDLKQIAERCSHLQSLNLFGCRNITDRGLKDLAQKCTQLKSLNLCSCPRITDLSIKDFAQNCTQLQKLELFNLNITDRGIKDLAQNCTQLQNLILNECNITDLSIKDVAQYCTQLQNLSLYYCKITAQGIKEVVEKCHNMKHLECYQKSGITQETITELEGKYPQLELIYRNF
jgi:hypothetical protein